MQPEEMLVDEVRQPGRWPFMTIHRLIPRFRGSLRSMPTPDGPKERPVGTMAES